MSIRSFKQDDSKYVYCISDQPSRSSKPTSFSRRSSSAIILPSRAVVPKSNSMTFMPYQRPKLALRPSGSGSSYSSQRPTLSSYPGESTDMNSDSMTGQYGTSDRCPRTKLPGHYIRAGQSEDDEEDGSMVLVKVPLKNVMPASSSTADLSKLSTGQLVKTVSKALSIDDLRREPGEQCAMDHRCSSGTDVYGLITAMRLESLLILLKRALNLYQDFDDSSGDIFIRSTHDEFFTNINQIIVDIADVALPLGTWLRRRRSKDQACQIQKTLRTAYAVTNNWLIFFDWKLSVSESMVRSQQEEFGKVRRATWERRRRECIDVRQRLLRLLSDIEMDEGSEGILDMQKGLRRRWKDDGMVGTREAERMGWVWGVGT